MSDNNLVRAAQVGTSLLSLKAKLAIAAAIAIILTVALLSMSVVMVVNSPAIGSTTACTPSGQAGTDTPMAAGSILEQQLANARTIDQVATELGLSGQASQVAIIAAIGESDLINIKHGDAAGPDSTGLFQQRDTWGPVAQRRDPATATKFFLLGPKLDGKNHGPGGTGLVAIKGWESLTPTQAIHAVQINADPNHYARYYDRAASIIRRAGIDTARAGSRSEGAPPGAAQDGCQPDTNLPPIGTGPCPLDPAAASLRKNPGSCQGALEFLTAKMERGDRDAYRQCLAIVARAYGWSASGFATAYLQGKWLQDHGHLSTERTNIPRGAVLYWASPTPNGAGHVAIYDGAGHILSNDVPVTDGRIGRVPWDYPETVWGQTFMGWSVPYFPRGV